MPAAVASPGGRRLRTRRAVVVVLARVCAAVLAYLAALTAATLVLAFVGFSVVPDIAQGPFALAGLSVAEGAAIGAVLAIWRFVDRRPVHELGLQLAAVRRQWLRGAGVGALMMGFVVLVWYTLLDGATWEINADVARAGLALLGGLVGFLVQGAAEELLFRGYVLDNLRYVFGLPWAIALSAIGFAILHAPNPAFGLLPFANLVLFSVAMALYRLRVDRGQLWGVFGIHSVWNWLQQVVFGLPNSGMESGPGNTLFSVRPNAALPEPIWGGGFGPEGTLAATLVLAALIAATLRRSATTRKETA